MSAVWMWMAKNDGTCGRRQGGRAGARFSRPPEQPLAPEVASGHLGHAVVLRPSKYGLVPRVT